MPPSITDTPPQPGDPGYPQFVQLLGRLDERTKRMAEQHADFREEVRAEFKAMKETHSHCLPREAFEQHIEECRDTHDKMATKEQVEPIKTIVFGAVGVILLAFLAGLLVLIGWKH